MFRKPAFWVVFAAASRRLRGPGRGRRPRRRGGRDRRALDPTGASGVRAGANPCMARPAAQPT